MLAIFIRDSAVKLFGLTAKLGLQRIPLFNRAFLALYLIYKEYFEAGPVDRLREFVPAGSLVIDVGANVGFFALRFARWVGNDGKVIAIEPEDRNYIGLTEAIGREGLSSRVDIVKAVAAAGFIHILFTQQYLGLSGRFAVAVVGDVAAFYADGVQFGDIICNGKQVRHLAKWITEIVHIKPCNNDANPF